MLARPRSSIFQALRPPQRIDMPTGGMPILNRDRSGRRRRGQAARQDPRVPAAPFEFVVLVTVVAAMVSGVPPCSGVPVPGHRLTLTPRPDPADRSRDRRTDSSGGASGTTSFFGMEASDGFDLTSETIEICTSAARCGTFDRHVPGRRLGEPVPAADSAPAGAPVSAADSAPPDAPRRYWWGHDGNSTLNLITHGADDHVFGSLVDGDGGFIYNFGHDAQGVPLVRATPASEFSELHADEEELPADPRGTADGPERRRRDATQGIYLNVQYAPCGSMVGACPLVVPRRRG